MISLTNLKKISIKNHPGIDEKMVQEYIADHPEALGLGRLELKQKEKLFSNASGRLDLLFADERNDSRYEVEVQLGSSDPDHIIRTIEYWDLAKRRQPQYDHYAVLVAEDITSRFLNVISLFNGNIPFIAVQVSAYETENGISLGFTKVIDTVTFEDDDDGAEEIKDRGYWENRSTPRILSIVDSIFNDFSDYASGYEPKYNKHYIGIQKEGIANNFIIFRPRKTFLLMKTKGNEDQELISSLEDAGIETKYANPIYEIRVNSLEDYQRSKNLIEKLIKMSMPRFGVEPAASTDEMSMQEGPHHNML